MGEILPLSASSALVPQNSRAELDVLTHQTLQRLEPLEPAGSLRLGVVLSETADDRVRVTRVARICLSGWETGMCLQRL